MKHWLFCTLMLLVSTVSAAEVAVDTLEIVGLNEGEDAVVVVSGRFQKGEGGCRKDWVMETGRRSGSTHVIRLSNLLAADRCISEVAVFSRDHAMVLRSVDWADAAELRQTPLHDARIKVPITIWIVDPTAEQRARAEMNNANLLFKENFVGVEFVPHFEPLWTKRGAPEIIDRGVLAPIEDGEIACTKNIEDFQGHGFYTPGRLNVYYLTLKNTGRNCAILESPSACPADGAPRGDGNVTFIGSHANLATLAHELGHAFGLRPGSCAGHVDGLGGFSEDNIMVGQGPPTRRRFTLGQAFRMNTHDDEWGGTMLLENKLRSGPRRACLPAYSTDRCPALGTDWLRTRSGTSAPRELVLARDPAEQALTRWLRCEQCTVEDLRALTDFGNAIVPRLSVVLGRTAPAVACDEACEALKARYDELKQQEQSSPEFMFRLSRDEFVKFYGESIVKDAVRAARALGAIGTDEARATLASAWRRTTNPTVRGAIGKAFTEIIR